jgi:hypothetical protein
MALIFTFLLTRVVELKLRAFMTRLSPAKVAKSDTSVDGRGP